MKYQNNTYNTDFLPKFDKDFVKKQQEICLLKV